LTSSSLDPSALPVIDLQRSPGGTPIEPSAAARIDAAAREFGFFLITGHGVDRALTDAILDEARAFFDLRDSVKSGVSMRVGGRAWRGWFPVGGELTSGVADVKEGLYLGTELPPDDARVREGRPMHGANVLPDRERPQLRRLVSLWMEEMTRVARALVEAMSSTLGTEAARALDAWLRDPVRLLRFFHYPPEPEAAGRWGVGEHTDYGLLTLLLQDDVGGLEVKTRAGWIDVPPLDGALVVNVGDMFDRLTGGLYRSLPHRVRAAPRHRYSIPFFFDPDWDARLHRLDLPGRTAVVRGARWDAEDLDAFSGTYGEYLSRKVSRVFPELFADAVDAPETIRAPPA